MKPALAVMAVAMFVLMGACLPDKVKEGVAGDAEEYEDVAEATEATVADCVIEYNGSQTIAEKPSTTVVIDFNAVWCGPCRQFAPVFHDVAAKYKDKATFYSVDVDKNQQLARRFNVRAIPTVVVIEPNGATRVHTGYMDALQLEQLIENK